MQELAYLPPWSLVQGGAVPSLRDGKEPEQNRSSSRARVDNTAAHLKAARPIRRRAARATVDPQRRGKAPLHP
jgi:hypothetical protein